MKSDNELLAHAASQRERLTTVVATAHVWNDRPRAAAAWQSWLASRPPGSVSGLTTHESSRSISGWVGRIADHVRTRTDDTAGPPGAVTPFDGAPSSMTSRLWLDRPGRWRVETTADGGDATGVLVRDGDRWDFEVVGSDEREDDPRESDGRSSLTLHAVVADMIDADRLLGLLNLELAGTTLQADRACHRLIGSLIDPDDFPVWPADSYELLLDDQMGIILRFEASSGGEPYARAEFTDVTFGEEISADVFEPKSVPKAQ